jgi:hypothetical protein
MRSSRSWTRENDIGRRDNALRSRKHDEEAQLYAFDVMALDREDLRGLPLTMRKRTSPRYWRSARTASLSAVRTGRDRA